MEIKFADILAFLGIVLAVVVGNNAQPLVPAIITFGDSSVDVGNNDYIPTLFKANYPPYGRDFINRTATGRFCNGKLATDLIADTLGFTAYPPAYLSPEANGMNIVTGTNFASAASGYDDKTAILSHAIPLSQQLQFYKDYQRTLAGLVGKSNAQAILSGAIYIIGAGSSDFIQNYYVNPWVNKVFSVDEYSSYLVGILRSFIKDLYKLGARKIGLTSLPPLGCLPATITLFGDHSNSCVKRLNVAAQRFNQKVNATATQLLKQLSGLNLVIFDIYDPLYDLIQRPQDFGFAEARKACCGTGVIETTIFLCNPKSIGTCSNATEYVFWDSVHPSDAANNVLANALVLQGIQLIG